MYHIIPTPSVVTGLQATSHLVHICLQDGGIKEEPMMFEWNYGDILDAVDEITPPERPALIHGDRIVNWGAFGVRSNNLAQSLLNNGAKPGEKIAFYMRNRPEYAEGIAAGFKARLVHTNVNYRYINHELIYLLDNADATIVIYAAEFAPQVTTIRQELSKVHQWIEVDDGHPGGDDVLSYETLANNGDGAPLGNSRSPDDLLFLYTGGTTGMPKGVMWRHQDLWCAMGAGGNPRLNLGPSANLSDFLERLQAEDPPVNLPLPPIMHGTGLLSTINAMCHGGTAVMLTERGFNANEALAAIDRHNVTAATIVGDAFARPIAEALEEQPGKYDFSSLRLISSSGVMWTRDVKARLLNHNPNLRLVDGFSSSEAIGLGSSVMTKDHEIEVAKFTLGPKCRVFTEDFREIEPGSDESGMVGVTGFLPTGYYKDEEKTARTFPIINGVRYSIPGDWVRVEHDGTLTLLGRGSNCINTAGEKVYPEEVEEALKHHESVADALVVGLPDERWGQAITAVVKLNPDFDLDEIGLREFTRNHLAGYKLPKRIFAKQDLERAANGKADYSKIRDFAKAALQSQ